MFIKPTNVYEIKKIISELHSGKSPGYDGFSAKVIKAISEFVCEPLSHICNLTFVTGCFPDRLKLAKVIPLYKSENKKMVLNYRPIWKSLCILDFMNFLIIISYYMKISTDLGLNIPLTWHY